MKTFFLSLTLAVFALSFSSCEDTASAVMNDPVPTLTTDEISDLSFMREEEKLARDVYLYAYEAYNLNIFKNIASSEQTHMDRMGALIETYSLIDPITDDTHGVFQNEDLQSLYQALTAQVNVSLSAALAVGATIEDLDISDLNQALSRTTQADIQTAYEMLRCGSGNHLRAFVGQLEQQNANYTPQYLSTQEYQIIIDGSHEHCGR